MRVLDLFSGIGAFSLGLERAGMKTISFCEIDPFCRRVLAKHWPEVHCYHDVRELSAQHLTADGHSDIDVICGGFPCQDISVAGKGAGIAGERSGLWREFARLIGEIRPRYAIVENVAALLGRGLGDVLGDLAALGYDAEWHCIPAAYVGAPHIRDRVWIVAYAARCGWDGTSVAETREYQNKWTWKTRGRGCFASMANAKSDGWAERRSFLFPHDSRESGEWTGELGRSSTGEPWQQHWMVEPDVGRVAHGIASRVDRLRGLGNSLVPQIPELIGRAIMAAEAVTTETP